MLRIFSRQNSICSSSLELLRQMTIVESPILPLGQLHNSLHRLFLDLALTGPTSIAMDHSPGSLFGYPPPSSDNTAAH
jgi:hypothetical protein